MVRPLHEVKQRLLHQRPLPRKKSKVTETEVEDEVFVDSPINLSLASPVKIDLPTEGFHEDEDLGGAAVVSAGATDSPKIVASPKTVVRIASAFDEFEILDFEHEEASPA